MIALVPSNDLQRNRTLSTTAFFARQVGLGAHRASHRAPPEGFYWISRLIEPPPASIFFHGPRTIVNRRTEFLADCPRLPATIPEDLELYRLSRRHGLDALLVRSDAPGVDGDHR